MPFLNFAGGHFSIERYEHIAQQLDTLCTLHGVSKIRFSFIRTCTDKLERLDDGAVDSALERLIETKDGPLCYGLIYQEVRRICAERGLPDPDDDDRNLSQAADLWDRFPLTNSLIQ